MFNIVPTFGDLNITALSIHNEQILTRLGYVLGDTTEDKVDNYPIQAIVGLDYYGQLWYNIDNTNHGGLYVWQSIFVWCK